MPPNRSSTSTHAVIFDFDGTLVDSAPSMARALNDMARRRGAPPVALESVRRWVSLGGEAMLCGALGADIDLAADLDELRRLLRKQTADPADLYPGVLQTLAALKEMDYRVGVCTNKREDIAIPYAAGLGIAPYLDTIVGGADGRRLKPDPELARMALDQLGATPQESIFVGDSEIDAEAARNAGIPFVLVTFGYPHGDVAAIQAHARLVSLIGLADVVAKLFR